MDTFDPEPTQAETDALNATLAVVEKGGDLLLPYIFTILGVTISGVVNIKRPIEKSWTEGVVVGYIVGKYRLDKDHPTATLYDPTGSLLRLALMVSFPERFVSARLDTRNIFTGKWDKGDPLVFRF